MLYQTHIRIINNNNINITIMQATKKNTTLTVKLVITEKLLPDPNDNHTRTLVTKNTRTYHITSDSNNPSSGNINVSQSPITESKYWSW